MADVMVCGSPACKSTFQARNRNMVYCQPNCRSFMTRMVLGTFPRTVCPRCGKRNLTWDNQGYGACVGCGYTVYP